MALPFRPTHILLGLAIPFLLGVSWPWSSPPTAISFEATVQEEGETPVSLAADQKMVSYRVIDSPEHGTLSGTSPHLIYRPDANFFGQDQFRYLAKKNQKTGPIATVKIQVFNVNDPPQGTSKKLELTGGQRVPVKLEAHDLDGDPLNFAVLHRPNHGTLSGVPPFLTYSPNAGFQGEDSFSFVVTDLDIRGKPATIVLQVGPPKPAPVLRPKVYLITQGADKDFFLDTEQPGEQKIRFELVQGPKSGTLTKVKQGHWSYRPGLDFVGNDLAVFRAYDGEVSSAPAKVRFKVTTKKSHQQWSREVRSLLGEGGLGIGEGQHPDLVYGKQSYTPASVIKLATAAAALEILGAETRFKTLVYRDRDNNLIIKGLGDPGFATQDWVQMGKQLKQSGVFDRPIHHLCLDLSAYERPDDFEGKDPGIEPYNAPIGPMMTNENLASLVVSSRGVRSYDRQTPLTNGVRRRAKGLPRGFQQFNLATNPKAGAQYSLEIADRLFRKLGMKRKGALKFQVADKTAALVLRYQSKKTVKALVRRMLHRSSNYIANQLVMALAMQANPGPAQLDQGVQVLVGFLEQKAGLQSSEIYLSEGSGLSRDNQVSLLGMLKLVNYFAPYQDLLPHLKGSQHHEFRGSAQGLNVRLKTGTLTGVSNVVGYIQLQSGGYKPFVIFSKEGRSVRGDVLALLIKAYSGV